VKAITNPRTDKEKLFAKKQEDVRKGVERVFGVMLMQFQILYRPCRMWHLSSMQSVIIACVAIRNMVVLERKDSYTGTRVAELGGRDVHSGVVRINKSPQTEAEHVQLWRTVAVPVESRGDHQRLKNALIDHIWSWKGETASSGSVSDEE
jgi:hypothetical protein